MKQLSALKFTFQDRNITVNSEAVLIEEARIWENLRKTRMARAVFTIGSNRCSTVIRVILQSLISLAFM